MTPQEVGDEMSKGLHMMKHFEKEMNHHPFGHKLITIGKPMMLGGLHNAMGMMEPEVMHHMCHHRGHHHCKSLVNNIVKGIILFLIWKIFEGIDNKCCGMCESECIRKFKNDLNECYNKIRKVNSLLNESTSNMNSKQKLFVKVNSLYMLEAYWDDIKRQTKDFWNAKPNSGMAGMANAMFNMYDFERINKFLDDEFARTKRPEYMEIKTMIDNYRSVMRGRNIAFGIGVGRRLLGKK